MYMFISQLIIQKTESEIDLKLTASKFVYPASSSILVRKFISQFFGTIQFNICLIKYGFVNCPFQINVQMYARVNSSSRKLTLKLI